MRVSLPLCLLLSLSIGCSYFSKSKENESPRAIIERAINAHGGEQKIVSFYAGRTKSHGTIYGKKIQPTSFTQQTIYQMPGSIKHSMQAEVNGRTEFEMECFHDGKGWMRKNKGPSYLVTAMFHDKLRAGVHACNVEMLVPLLKEERFTLEPLLEITVNGRPAVGVKVSAQGNDDIKLYFDKETGLQVKTVRPILNFHTLKFVEGEFVYSDFKEFDGYKSPTKITAFHGGLKIMELEVTDYQHLDSVNPAEFAEPPSGS
jgi:hypothetical protein